MAHFSRRLAAAAFITALALPVLAQTAAPVAAGENSATATSTPSASQRLSNRMAGTLSAPQAGRLCKGTKRTPSRPSGQRKQKGAWQQTGGEIQGSGQEKWPAAHRRCSAVRGMSTLERRPAQGVGGSAIVRK